MREQGLDLDEDTVDARLSYLVEHGNLARSPRETEARSLQEYLRNRARYQLTQRGELVQRQVEELLGHAETATEISSEMLGGILAGLRDLSRLRPTSAPSTRRTSRSDIGTIFAQFDRLVHSTREFYTYLTQVLGRYDLDRGEFQAFKTALLDYLQRFVDEIARHMPQIAEVIAEIAAAGWRCSARGPTPASGCSTSRAGPRGARRGSTRPTGRGCSRGSRAGDSRASDADGVRRLAAEAMRALLVNLRRIVTSSEREHGRYADLLRLARWFDEADDATAHALWASAFGLYSCRHLGFAADESEAPSHRPRPGGGRRGRGAGHAAVHGSAPHRRVVRAPGGLHRGQGTPARRSTPEQSAARRRAVARSRANVAGSSGSGSSDAGREALLELYAAGSPHGHGPAASAGFRDDVAVPVPGHEVVLRVSADTRGRAPRSPARPGGCALVDRTLAVEPSATVAGPPCWSRTTARRRSGRRG